MGRALTRRRVCAGSAAVIASLALAARRARALGRPLPIGKLAVSVPWPVGALDPHDLFDPTAALFGHAVFDQLFALEASGDPYPTLAADVPAVEGNKTIVRLRDGLTSASGRRLDARDVLFSLARARRGPAAAWWSDLPTPALQPKDPLALVFATNDALRVARVLTSPLFAVVPRGFDPRKPDGTGAMIAEPGASRLVLRRNPNAARGASFLEEVAVDQSSDLLSSLRAFEGSLTDIGWLSSGLHAPRPGATPFDFGGIAWIVLQTGPEAGSWGAPGVAQRLLDGVEPARLQRFGLGTLPAPTGSADWGGKPCELLLEEGSVYLEEVGRTLASLLSKPSHDVAIKTLPRQELARRRAAGAFALMLGVVRPFASGGVANLVSLAAASDPTAALELARHPPRLTTFAPRTLTRTLKLGVLGELRVAGAHAADVRLGRSTTGEGWDLGATFRVPPT